VSRANDGMSKAGAVAAAQVAIDNDLPRL